MQPVEIEAVKYITLGKDGFDQANAKVVVTLVSEVEERLPQ